MQNQTTETTASYFELSSQAYTLLVDSFSSANQRGLEYLKSAYEIASRPYNSSAAETTVRENFDRANQLVSLTVNALQTSGQKNVELAQSLVAHNAKVQDSLAHAVRGVIKTGISNVNYIKGVTDAQFDDAAKRVEELQRNAASVSQN